MPADISRKDTARARTIPPSCGSWKNAAAGTEMVIAIRQSTAPIAQFTQNKLESSLAETFGRWMTADVVPRSRKIERNAVRIVAIPIRPYALGPSNRASRATEPNESTCRTTVESPDHPVPAIAFWLSVLLFGAGVGGVLESFTPKPSLATTLLEKFRHTFLQLTTIVYVHLRSCCPLWRGPGYIARAVVCGGVVGWSSECHGLPLPGTTG